MANPNKSGQNWTPKVLSLRRQNLCDNLLYFLLRRFFLPIRFHKDLTLLHRTICSGVLGKSNRIQPKLSLIVLSHVRQNVQDEHLYLLLRRVSSPIRFCINLTLLHRTIRSGVMDKFSPIRPKSGPDSFEPFKPKCSRQCFLFFPQKVLLADKILYRFNAPPSDDPFRIYG